MTKAIQFLDKIYSLQCEKGDYVILSAKKGNSWRDIPLRYVPPFKDKLEKFFREYTPEEYDLYWSPVPYSEPRRKKESVLDTKFLAQDIDEYEDPQSLKPSPSYIWESSPNKYQGLWELDRYIEEGEYTPLNRDLAKHIGCDDCFDIAHVYRIPGTINHKYKNHPTVGDCSSNGIIYKPKNLRKMIGSSQEDKPTKETPKDSSNESQNIQERKIYAKYSIPQKIRNLLALTNLEGRDRSSTIWYVEHKLHELGMSPQEIIFLVKNSVFNKYKGRSDEDSRLEKELEKIISGEISSNEEEAPESFLKVSNFQEVMGNSSTFEGWLVKGFWGRRSHGIVAGMPKCFKSTLVHDLIVSVASGKKFLGKYEVIDPGPVLVIQNENADYIMKDRTEKIILNRGLEGKVERVNSHRLKIEFSPDLPISFINQQGFTLSNPEHREQVEKLIQELSPVLVVFDPLYLMFEGDLNSSKELNPILSWLLNLKNQYKTSVMVIHHYNKGSQQSGSLKGGARMAGSIMLYGWVESAWYLTRSDEEEEDIPSSQDHDLDACTSSGSATVTLSREFRMAGSFPDVDIHFELGEIGDPKYKVDVTRSGLPMVRVHNLEEEVLQQLRTHNRPVTKSFLIEQMGIDRSTMSELLGGLLKSKKIVLSNGGYTISNS